ncbi:PAS domain S-box [Halovivax ruber XH-70]|uniref:PAS domain S-box n=1 Tax=Halovivax ruber (strain DSM 18193 / JCM 13892 / XH-70) TaxID=797302 RepID=L0IC85_HALRX|nr:PAS domain S-box [Halovivax ruber XH-70]
MEDGARPTYVTFWTDSARDSDPVRDHLENTPDISLTTTSVGEEMPPDQCDRLDCVVYAPDSCSNWIDHLEQLRETLPALPIVLLTDDPDGDSLSRAIAADIAGYVARSADDAPARVHAEIERVSAPNRSAVGQQTPRMPLEQLDDREERRVKERAMDEAPVGIAITDPDRPDNPLVYVNDSFEALTGYGPSETIGRNCRFLQGPETDPDAVAKLRAAIDAAEPVAVELQNYRADGEVFWNRVEIAPVTEHGQVTHFVGYQTDVTARKETEIRLARERETLETVLDRINGLLNDVTSDLVEAADRDAAERAVCDRLVEIDTYQAAWIGHPDLATGEITAATVSTDWGSPSDESAPVAGDDDPIVAAVTRAEETGRTQLVTEPAALDRIETADWYDGGGLEGIAALPLSNGETAHGVLCVYAGEGGAVTKREAVVLEALARATATTIDAIERGRLLLADEIVELDIEITDPSFPFVTLAERAGPTVSYDGAVSSDDGRVRLFLTIDAEPAAVSAAVDDLSAVAEATLIHEYDEGNLYELVMTETSIVSALAARGATTRSISAADGATRLTVEISSDRDVRELVDDIRAQYDGVELRGRRDRDRPPTTRQEYLAELENALTDRQHLALRIAHASGYYEWNRSVSGDELASAMGVARSTYHQHRRAAERKLVSAFLDR